MRGIGALTALYDNRYLFFPFVFPSFRLSWPCQNPVLGESSTVPVIRIHEAGFGCKPESFWTHKCNSGNRSGDTRSQTSWWTYETCQRHGNLKDDVISTYDSVTEITTTCHNLHHHSRKCISSDLLYHSR